MSYTAFLEENGWVLTDLNYNNLDIDNTIFFGHVTEPNQRHTKGLAQYLINTNQVRLLDDNNVNRLLVSAVFDEHTYSISMMMPQLVNYVNWIPLDYSYRHFNGDALTNRFFKQHKLDLEYNGQHRLNVADSVKKAMYDKINNLKQQYDWDYQKLVKNFLEPDLKIYLGTVEKYNNTNLDVL